MMVPHALRGKDFVVVDVEGNGQTPPEIIEIAVLPVSGETVVVEEMRSWLIRPTRPITPIVTRKVHGITNAEVAECPSWSEVAEKIEASLTDRILVAHNANLERRIISEHLPDWTPPMVLDTLKLAKTVWPGIGGYSLDKLVTHAELDTTAVCDQGHHRAGWDTWAAWQLLVRLVDDSGFSWTELVKAAAPAEFIAPREPEARLW
ncbi:3'-5' exonuclease [Nocardia pseudovaccinii]|uniref:3'-5' exonuclease n=1 Tax=Nocardia pseudovaccinii TaxID=189540 RepID=UPI0007A3AE7E|nr:3'-5' exonuclease [Nocardia pseudovaccinii]